MPCPSLTHKVPEMLGGIKYAHCQGKVPDWAPSLASGFFQMGGFVRKELEPRGLRGFPQADWFLFNVRGKDQQGSSQPLEGFSQLAMMASW